MNTQDNLNLDVEYLEVVTCTYSELCKIKKPTNGRLYHTSDTNEFYFDWNNKRHKLSVFTTDKSESSDVVKKSELGAWLKKNNYITNLSLTDALIDVIGSPIENIITKQALENYSKNYLLTKEELNLLNEPLNLINEIESLKSTDKTLFSFCERLANQVNEIRSIANDKISSGELDTKLGEYVKKSLADSIYLSKEDAGQLYIDEEEFVEKLKGYVTNEQLTESLKPYQKKSEADSKYATKSDSDNKYLQKSVASKTYATKSEVSNTYETKKGVDEKLSGYVKQEDTANFAKKSDVESSYVKKEELSKYETKSGADNKLTPFAKKVWVNQYFTQKTDLKRILNDYATKEYIVNQLSTYATNKSVDDKIAQTNREIIDIENKFAKYVTKSQLDSKVAGFVTKSYADSTYLTTKKLNDRLSVYEKTSDVDDKLNEYTKNEEFARRLKEYLTKTQISDTYVSKSSLKDYVKKSDVDFEAFAKKVWVDEYYMKKFKLSDYLKADDIFEIFLQKSMADEVYLKKNDAEKTYAKIVDIIGLAKNDVITREESKAFAKKVWVDEYYMRKGQIEGIKNAMVLSQEFETERDLRNSERNIQQGFYYLTKDKILMVAIDDGNGGKIFVDVTNLETGLVLYFGGDDVNW
jgi:hypothetical protein